MEEWLQAEGPEIYWCRSLWPTLGFKDMNFSILFGNGVPEILSKNSSATNIKFRLVLPVKCISLDIALEQYCKTLLKCKDSFVGYVLEKSYRNFLKCVSDGN